MWEGPLGPALVCSDVEREVEPPAEPAPEPDSVST